MTHRLTYNPHLHTSQMFEVMVEALTRDPAVLPTFDFVPPADQPFPVFRARPNERAEIDALLQRENPQLGDAPLILLNPNASDLLPLRRWPPSRYVEIARKLLERYPDLFVGFTGAPAEAEAINRLARRCRVRSSNRPGRKDHAPPAAGALHAQCHAGHERQRPGAFRLHDTDPRRHLVRTGDARALRGALGRTRACVGRESPAARASTPPTTVNRFARIIFACRPSPLGRSSKKYAHLRFTLILSRLAK